VELESDKQLFILGALNSFSPRFFSFTVPVGERFIDPFFRFLDSPDKSAEVF
jgi:hypothetical protein